jgi:hypothetical protein
MVSIRKALQTDFEAIQAVHRESIENVASHYYRSKVIEQWAKNLGQPETIARHRDAIRAGAEVTVVAEQNGEISALDQSSRLKMNFGLYTLNRRVSVEGLPASSFQCSRILP